MGWVVTTFGGQFPWLFVWFDSNLLNIFDSLTQSLSITSPQEGIFGYFGERKGDGRNGTLIF